MAAAPDFESLGLLDGLDSSAPREGRTALLTQLHEAGVSVDELRTAVAEGRLALLPAERVLAGEPRYTSADIAERSGLASELLTAQRQASGLPVAAPDERAFSEEDLEAALSFKRFVDAGLSGDALLESTHTFGQAAARIAAATRTMAELLRPGESERDGPSVNLASRVTTIARPGSLLVTRETRDATPDSYSWSHAGRREIKGVAGQVVLYRCRHDESRTG